MATVVPNEGLDWYRDSSIGVNSTDNEIIYSVGVGDGSVAVSTTDTQLTNELYRGTTDDSSVSITAQSATGLFTAEITVSGGTEVPAGSDISELGVWARDPSIADGNVTDSDDTMVYHEVRTATNVSSGDNKTFTIEIDITES